MSKLKLAQMLEKKGLSKRQFAKLLGVSYPAVFRYFRDGYDPKLSTLKRWAKAIECKIRDLYDEL
ncbi:MAG: helix-turn-helix transcriptional regulator [Bdellovibrionota bacterium]